MQITLIFARIIMYKFILKNFWLTIPRRFTYWPNLLGRGHFCRIIKRDLRGWTDRRTDELIWVGLVAYGSSRLNSTCTDDRQLRCWRSIGNCDDGGGRLSSWRKSKLYLFGVCLRAVCFLVFAFPPEPQKKERRARIKKMDGTNGPDPLRMGSPNTPGATGKNWRGGGMTWWILLPPFIRWSRIEEEGSWHRGVWGWA